MYQFVDFLNSGGLTTIHATGAPYTWTNGYRKQFKFEAVWLNHPKFTNIVKESWRCNFSGNPNDWFRSCANTFKYKITNWSKSSFGIIKNQIKYSQEELKQVQDLRMKHPDNINYTE